MILDQHYVPECQTILLGDAAVGMYSTLGQGCVYAMECAVSLAEELAFVPETKFAQTLDEVATSNMQEGKAIADLNLISHLMRTPITKFAGLLVFLRIVKSFSDTSDPYSAIAKQNRWAIRMSRPFWRWARTPEPFIVSTRNIKTL
jgi:2-polyprenyl-6-methoxyphenol hydroxylase-like FAD-dependent oxidoreductase